MTESKISSIESSKPKGWFELVTEGNPPLLIDGETIFKHSLKIGLELSDDQYAKIHGEAEIAWLKRRAMQVLARRMISERDLRRKLSEEGRSKWAREEVISLLKRYEYIDDGKCAASFVRTQLSHGPKSRLFLRQKLREKGIADEIAIQAIEIEYANIDEAGAIKEIAAKKYKTVKHLPPQKAKSRVINFLRGRGFSWDLIKKAIVDIIPNSTDSTEY